MGTLQREHLETVNYFVTITFSSLSERQLQSIVDNDDNMLVSRINLATGADVRIEPIPMTDPLPDDNTGSVLTIALIISATICVMLCLYLIVIKIRSPSRHNRVSTRPQDIGMEKIDFSGTVVV